MAFPTIAQTQTSSRASNSVNDSVTLPTTVAIAAGDLILVWHASDGTTTRTFPSPWVELRDQANSTNSVGVAYLIATGGETSVTVTKSSSERFSAIAAKILAAGWHGVTPPEIQASLATGDSASPDPASLTLVGWGVEDTLWIPFCAYDNSAGGNSISVYPFASNNTISPDVSSAGRCGICSTESAVTSLNSGAFTIPSDQWLAGTVAVRPTLGVRYEAPTYELTRSGGMIGRRYI